MSLQEIMQGLTLLAVGGIAKYLFNIEHRLTRIETRICNRQHKERQNDD